MLVICRQVVRVDEPRAVDPQSSEMNPKGELPEVAYLDRSVRVIAFKEKAMKRPGLGRLQAVDGDVDGIHRRSRERGTDRTQPWRVRTNCGVEVQRQKLIG